jgi:Holliday junction resolvase-like predicted endonuclease
VEQIKPLISDMQQQIDEGSTSGLEQNMRMLLARIPNILHLEKEAYYHSLFLTWMTLFGFDIQGEIQTNIGRIDAVWHQPGLTVIAEVKYHTEKNIDSLLDEAMAQISDRRYYEAYSDRKVTLMGVAFTGKEVKCRLESITQ